LDDLKPFTDNVKKQFDERAQFRKCVICGYNTSKENLKPVIIREADFDITFLYHKECLPKVTDEFASAMLSIKTIDDLNKVLND
jgi:hypothetical protein